ncbi:hypothetical protein BU25DRAFT_88081 [Macroventuria anomochaeta]|uniref:Uncharacterized protein n=1 Tax=Macroventuria anomochaeta TaxID=301207 RepID=A0ACB6SGF5_9PLEO|nr:uncharacterized protein BU25DRAFT_88081 [Macroventuria anomochaeta]KAF2633058.1 hypothetical protein BU25DRAFT_88081 [Macroventuria anomochaeta]
MTCCSFSMFLATIPLCSQECHYAPAESCQTINLCKALCAVQHTTARSAATVLLMPQVAGECLRLSKHRELLTWGRVPATLLGCQAFQAPG